ncbi:MAG TPA: glycosyl hydrolase family 18, partial [Rikenellaceae bacterium]|nr:glycosyl hydrolase family 18 [Rikenellaceae bacterium]
LWDRNANYAVAEEKGFPKVNTTSYPKLIKALREALGQNKLLTVTDHEEPTEYFWDTQATGGIKVGE